MRRPLLILAAVWLALMGGLTALRAQPAPLDRPAQVVVAEVLSGLVSPEAEFVGTIFYTEVSQVAAEVGGKVERIAIEDGVVVKKGQALAVVNADLLKRTIEAQQASLAQAEVELKKAEHDFRRVEKLFKEATVPEQSYDDHRFKVEALEKSAAAIRAELERLKVELSKKVVRAPFDGRVITKQVSPGEWLSSGSVVASLARADALNAVVNVPEKVLAGIHQGDRIKVEAGGRRLEGEVRAIIPKGDVATRSFPVKIQLNQPDGLIEGMEARVRLPIGPKARALMVPRDAVMNVFDRSVVFAVVEAKAVMIPVKVLGFERDAVGVQGEGLEPGMSVVIKGNERLMNGQPVAPVPLKP